MKNRQVRWVVRALIVVIAAISVFGFHHYETRRFVRLEFDETAIVQASQRTFDELQKIDSQSRMNTWITAREAVVAAEIAPRGAVLRADQQKKVVWASDDFQTALSIVYVHGFSASPLEIEPVISNVARGLHANLFFTRLKGHGISDGEDFASVRARDWAVDVEEAVAIGRRIGRRVILISMSTGAPLALEYVTRHARIGEARNGQIEEARNVRTRDLLGLVLLSPNYDPAASGTTLLEGSLGPWFARAVLGSHREFKTENELHAARWTSRYRSEGLAAMMTAVASARSVDFSQIDVPVLTIYTRHDRVVSAPLIVARSKEFESDKAGAKSETIDWPEAERHELASAAFYPDRVSKLSDLILGKLIVWQKLEIGSGELEDKSRERSR